MSDSRIIIDRPAYTNTALAQNHSLEWTEEPSIKEKLRKALQKKFACTKEAWKKRLLNFFPFIGIFQIYQWKKWLPYDVISGLSVGVIHIPQGMGFALLTSVPPVFGLYSSFFPLLIYFFFGTSRHISMGTMALISLMTGSIVDRESERIIALRAQSLQSANSTLLGANATLTEADIEAMHVDFAMSVSLLVGCFQVLMSILNLSKITLFMSKSFMGGYLNGAAVHIIGSQLLGLFGLKVKNPPGIFRIPRIIYIVLSNIASTNVCAIITGLICIIILFVLKEIINLRFKAKMKVPIPAEILVVVFGTLISHYCRLHERYDLRIIGNIPQGFPAPRIPSMTNAPAYMMESFVIAVVSFAISISMVNMMAEKYKYRVDPNQEMLAYGVAHGVSAMLNSFAGCQAPPRTLVHESVGGHTQLGSLVSCLMVFLVCMFLGPLLKSLPVPVLAAVIIVALLPLFKQFKDLPRQWRISKCDFFTWIITFLTIVIFDISIGLVTGIAVNVFMVVLQPYLTSGSDLVNIRHTEIYVHGHNLNSGEISSKTGVLVFSFSSPLFYITTANFKSQLLANTATHNKLHTIVIDCSAISYVDLMGVELLKTLHNDYRKTSINLVLAQVPLPVLRKLQLIGAISTEQLLQYRKPGESKATEDTPSDHNPAIESSDLSDISGDNSVEGVKDTTGTVDDVSFTGNGIELEIDGAMKSGKTDANDNQADQRSNSDIPENDTKLVTKSDNAPSFIHVYPTVHDAVSRAAEHGFVDAGFSSSV